MAVFEHGGFFEILTFRRWIFKNLPARNGGEFRTFLSGSRIWGRGVAEGISGSGGSAGQGNKCSISSPDASHLPVLGAQRRVLADVRHRPAGDRTSAGDIATTAFHSETAPVVTLVTAGQHRGDAAPTPESVNSTHRGRGHVGAHFAPVASSLSPGGLLKRQTPHGVRGSTGARQHSNPCACPCFARHQAARQFRS